MGLLGIVGRRRRPAASTCSTHYTSSCTGTRAFGCRGDRGACDATGWRARPSLPAWGAPGREKEIDPPRRAHRGAGILLILSPAWTSSASPNPARESRG